MALLGEAARFAEASKHNVGQTGRARDAILEIFHGGGNELSGVQRELYEIGWSGDPMRSFVEAAPKLYTNYR